MPEAASARLHDAPLRGPIRVLALIEAYTVTGPAKNLIEFARTARGARIEFPPAELTVVTFRRGPGEASDPFLDACRQAGVPVHVIRERFAFDPGVIPQLLAIVSAHPPDIVQTHNTKSHFLVLLTGIARRFPWVAFHHGYTRTDRKDRVYNRIDRWSLRSARSIVTVCDSFAARLRAHGVEPSRIAVRHNAVTPFSPAAAEQAERVRTGLGVRRGSAFLLSVGRLSAEKGHLDLIDAAALVRERKPSLDFRLVLVGEGPERAAIERRSRALGIADRIILAGRQNDVAPYYSLADVVVLPSHSEGLPNVLLEAMAAGLPIVATAVGGVPEIATDGRNALLVPERDPAAMAGGVIRLLEDPELCRRLRSAACQTARLLTPDAYCRAMLAHYAQVLRLPACLPIGAKACEHP